MRKIKLVADKPFHNNCDFAVFDVTEGKEKKRCKITVDYAQADIKELIDQGYDLESTLIYFKDWIYNTIKRYIADDWECMSGNEEIMVIIEDHIEGYFS